MKLAAGIGIAADCLSLGIVPNPSSVVRLADELVDAGAGGGSRSIDVFHVTNSPENAQSVLDGANKVKLNPETRLGKAPTSDATQAIGRNVAEAGYEVIRFNSLRGQGTNYAILANFGVLLKPQMVTPVW